MKNLVLRPNCLITPSPLIFLPGPRSLFFYKNMFGWLPEFLYQHGYDAQVLPLPFRNKAHISDYRAHVFQKWLDQHLNQDFHFIMDDITFHELESVFKNTKSAKSVTVLTTSPVAIIPAHEIHNFDPFLISKKESSAPLDYKLHQIYCHFLKVKISSFETTFNSYDHETFDRFLDHCVKLAENELYG